MKLQTKYGQKSLIDFCIVFAGLFSSVLDVRVKRGSELSTDQPLLVCSLRLLKPWSNRKPLSSDVTCRVKWETLEDKEVRKQFASSTSTKFRELPNVSDDVEIEWSLFRSAIILSAVECCGEKRFRVPADSEKRTPWWNQDVKETISAKKDAYKDEEQVCIRFAISVFRGAKSSKLSSKTVQGEMLGKVWSSAGFKV